MRHAEVRAPCRELPAWVFDADLREWICLRCCLATFLREPRCACGLAPRGQLRENQAVPLVRAGLSRTMPLGPSGPSELRLSLNRFSTSLSCSLKISWRISTGLFKFFTRPSSRGGRPLSQRGVVQRVRGHALGLRCSTWPSSVPAFCALGIGTRIAISRTQGALWSQCFCRLCRPSLL